MNNLIKISDDFSPTPGARNITDGDFSGEEFLNNILEPVFLNIKDTDNKLTINLDDTDGYATSFLDEAFGGLARKYGVEIVLSKIIFISNEEPELIDEIKSYMYGKEN